MKHYIKIVGVLILLITAGCASVGNNQAGTLEPFGQQTNDTNTKRTVQVSGMGEIQVAPDTAIINLGVQTQEKTVQVALEANNTKMQALIDTLKKEGVSSENILTQAIRLSPRYELDNTNNNRTLVGYIASNIVQVLSDNLDSVGTLLDQAAKAGANMIENISFEIRDPSKALDQARKMAVQNARHKAEELASQTGTTLGPIVEIQESSSTPVPVARQFEAANAAVPVSPGTQSVSVQVQVIWELVTKNGQ